MSYKEYLNNITTLIFDVDGVLTDGTILVATNGDMFRKMHTKDGYVLKYAVDCGYHICIISGGNASLVKPLLEHRFEYEPNLVLRGLLIAHNTSI